MSILFKYTTGGPFTLSTQSVKYPGPTATTRASVDTGTPLNGVRETRTIRARQGARLSLCKFSLLVLHEGPAQQTTGPTHCKILNISVRVSPGTPVGFNLPFKAQQVVTQGVGSSPETAVRREG